MVDFIRSMEEHLGLMVDNPYWENGHLAGEAWLVAALKETEEVFRKNADSFGLLRRP